MGWGIFQIKSRFSIPIEIHADQGRNFEFSRNLTNIENKNYAPPSTVRWNGGDVQPDFGRFLRQDCERSKRVGEMYSIISACLQNCNTLFN